MSISQDWDMGPATLYLASASPRRSGILDQLGIQYQVVPQDVDETPLAGERPEDLVCRLAALKANNAYASLPPAAGTLVLGADTEVVCDGRVLGKPADSDDARAMLGMLSGRCHQVLTAVAAVNSRGTEVLLSTSLVEFRHLKASEIDAYVASGEPAGKAGAYAIQGLAALFVCRIEGSYSGIVGLPVYETMALLAGAGISSETILKGGK